jgi:hypothetical protein
MLFFTRNSFTISPAIISFFDFNLKSFENHLKIFIAQEVQYPTMIITIQQSVKILSNGKLIVQKEKIYANLMEQTKTYREHTVKKDCDALIATEGFETFIHILSHVSIIHPFNHSFICCLFGEQFQ